MGIVVGVMETRQKILFWKFTDDRNCVVGSFFTPLQ